MLNPLIKWWTRDTTLHSFVLCQFLIGLPFSVFNTYVVYQLQVVGYLIGSDGTGSPCTTYCIVSWAGSKHDLNSVLLYLNAFAFGLGGIVTLGLSAYSDFWSRKHLLVTVSIICYGAFSIPVYWLQGHGEGEFQTLTALYVVFNIVTLILIAVLNIYIPYCMRKAGAAAATDMGGVRQTGTADGGAVTNDKTSRAQRRYGFNMATWGYVAVAAGAIVMFVIVIILSETLPEDAAQASGLLVTSIVGFIAVAGSVVALLGLPAMTSRKTSELKADWSRPLVEFFMPFKEILTRRSAGALLLSYTIYTDSVFAVSSAISQLYVAEVHPGALEYSVYALAQNICLLCCSLAFLWIRPCLRIKLETWLIIGYGLVLLIPLWACIGFTDVGFGFKNRWEFYAQLVLFFLSQAFVNSAFRVLFSEMIPVGSEVRWFGMQLVLSCATVWINYVASGPLQNATHQLRFPLVVSLVFLLFAFTLEICRVSLGLFLADQKKWLQFDDRVWNEPASNSHGQVTREESKA